VSTWPEALTGPDVLLQKGRFDVIDELSAEFTTDPPCQPTLAWLARREYDGELGGNVEIFRNYPHATVRHVRDRAVALQRAYPELDLRDPSARTTFASASIHQHVDPSPFPIKVHPTFQTFYGKLIEIRLAGSLTMSLFFLNSVYRAPRTYLELPWMVLNAGVKIRRRIARSADPRFADTAMLR
jgi:hypothetical protein